MKATSPWSSSSDRLPEASFWAASRKSSQLVSWRLIFVVS